MKSLQRFASILLTSSLLAGCGALDRSSAYTAYQLRSEIVEVSKAVESMLPASAGPDADEPGTVEVTVDSLKEVKQQVASAGVRAAIFAQQFGEPSKKSKAIKRGSDQDKYETRIHGGIVRARKVRVEFIRKIGTGMRRTLRWTGYLLKWGPIALIAVGLLLVAAGFYRSLRSVYGVLVRLIGATAIDSQAKRSISEGTPVQRAYRRTQKKGDG